MFKCFPFKSHGVSYSNRNLTKTESKVKVMVYVNVIFSFDKYGTV